MLHIRPERHVQWQQKVLNWAALHLWKITELKGHGNIKAHPALRLWLNAQVAEHMLHREDSQLTSHFDTNYWGEMLASMQQEHAEAGVAGAMAASAAMPMPAGPHLPDPGAIATSAVCPPLGLACPRLQLAAEVTAAMLTSEQATCMRGGHSASLTANQAVQVCTRQELCQLPMHAVPCVEPTACHAVFSACSKRD